MVEIAEIVLVLVFVTVADVGTPLLIEFSIVLSLTSCVMDVLSMKEGFFPRDLSQCLEKWTHYPRGLALLSRTLA
eukprot:15337518-Ditylum_brightwellii.AAC.1